MLLVVDKASFVDLPAQVDLSSMALHSVLDPVTLAYEVIADVHALTMPDVSAVSPYCELSEVDMRLVVCQFVDWPASASRDHFDSYAAAFSHDLLDKDLLSVKLDVCTLLAFPEWIEVVALFIVGPTSGSYCLQFEGNELYDLVITVVEHTRFLLILLVLSNLSCLSRSTFKLSLSYQISYKRTLIKI